MSTTNKKNSFAMPKFNGNLTSASSNSSSCFSSDDLSDLSADYQSRIFQVPDDVIFDRNWQWQLLIDGEQSVKWLIPKLPNLAISLQTNFSGLAIGHTHVPVFILSQNLGILYISGKNSALHVKDC